ncbi:MAG: phosphate ABC transporter permease subunit PstC, partial [Mariprofundaceae bacterium]|nr:phosphate ABC transporter permease subunit PstC [Mariprofundaceae bacterium]
MSTASSSKSGFTSDQVFRLLTSAFAALIAILFIVMLSVLWHESQPSIDKFGFSFLTSSAWNPVTNEYGALIAIVGTLLTTTVAMAIALPISFGIALFLAEISPYWMRTPVGTAIELLAAIP